jgi:hypothetical protein
MAALVETTAAVDDRLRATLSTPVERLTFLNHQVSPIVNVSPIITYC